MLIINTTTKLLTCYRILQLHNIDHCNLRKSFILLSLLFFELLFLVSIICKVCWDKVSKLSNACLFSNFWRITHLLEPHNHGCFCVSSSNLVACQVSTILKPFACQPLASARIISLNCFCLQYVNNYACVYLRSQEHLCTWMDPMWPVKLNRHGLSNETHS